MRNEVIFEGGQSRATRDGYQADGCYYYGCNYMIAACEDADGDEVELYAEYLAPDDLDGEDVNAMDAFDKESYPILKEEILRQAKENGVDVDSLAWPFDESND